MIEHICYTLLDIIGVGTPGFSRIAAAIQKVGLGDSTPCCCNRVHLEDLESGRVLNVTGPLSIHLKYIDRGEYLVLKQVDEMQVGSEGVPLGVESDSLDVGDVAAVYSFLHSAEIIDESTLVGR